MPCSEEAPQGRSHSNSSKIPYIDRVVSSLHYDGLYESSKQSSNNGRSKIDQQNPPEINLNVILEVLLRNVPIAKEYIDLL